MRYRQLFLLPVVAALLFFACAIASGNNQCEQNNQILDPRKFPPLPPSPFPADQLVWSPSVRQAYNTIQEGYDRAVQLLRLEEPDPLRLRIHSDNLFRRLLPILQSMDEEVGKEWTLTAGELLLQLVAELEESANAADEV